MSGFGSFAGGLARGVTQGMQLSREKERYEAEKEDREYRREERGRERQIREAAGATLGRIGTDVTSYAMGPDAEGGYETPQWSSQTQPYTARQGNEDYSRRIAGLDPVRSAQARGMADQEEVRGLQLKGARRQQNHADAEDAFLAFQRQNNHLPDDQYYLAAAEFASKHVPDGRAFGIDMDPDKGYQVVMLQPGGAATRHPIPSRQALESQLAMYISPGMFRQSQQDARQQRQLDISERHYANQDRVAAQNAGTQEQYRRDQAPVLAAQAGYYSRRGEGATGARQRDHWVPLGLDRDGQPVFFNQSASDLTSAVARPDGKPVQDPGVFRRLTGDRPQGGLRALGTGGLMTDGTRAYDYDSTARKFIPVEMPGQSAFDRYSSAAGTPAPSDGLPSLTSPTSFRPGIPPSERVARVNDPQTGLSITQEEYDRKYGSRTRLDRWLGNANPFAPSNR